MKHMIVSVLTAFLLCACAAEVYPPLQDETSGSDTRFDILVDDESREGQPGLEGYMTEKARIVTKVENRMRVVLGETVRRFEDIRARSMAEQAELRPPVVIEAVELPLKHLYNDEEKEYERILQRSNDRYLAEMDSVLEYVTEKVWEIAFDVVGSEDVGAGYDTRTGIVDVDDVVNSTIELILFRAGRDEYIDDGEYQKRKRIKLSRIYKNDTDDLGRLTVYASEPLYNFFSPLEDGIAYTVAFHNELGVETRLKFRQAVRDRVTRGGSDVYNSGFHWDTTVGNADGMLPLKIGGDGSPFTVSQVFFPRLDIEASGFETMNDFTAVRDFKTAVIEVETGAILDCVSWQLIWQVSHSGDVSTSKGSTPLRDEDLEEFTSLLERS